MYLYSGLAVIFFTIIIVIFSESLYCHTLSDSEVFDVLSALVVV